jgi:phenylacetate-CoA ligase
MAKLDRLYQAAPLWLQNMMVSVYGLYWYWARFSGDYPAHERGYRHREHFSTEDWRHYQHQTVQNLLTLCVNQVPYYRETWSREDKKAAMAGNLSELPILEKDPLRQNPNRFHNQGAKPFPRFVFHTSGTTGTPISTTYTLSEHRSIMALREVRSANWAGVSFKQPRATFSGRMIEPNPEEHQAVYRYNVVEKQVYFSAFHLKPNNAQAYVDALLKHSILWMTGYTVSFFLLARFILEQNLPVPPLKAIVTTSEKLTPKMRTTIEQAFRCPVFEEYSTVENAMFGSQCEHGRLHLSPDAGFVEILRQDGSPCDPGEVGEVITTCLLRSYQPLIRFRLGDLAAWDPNPCPCGRQMPVITEVVGRIEDVVTGPDGRQLVRFHGIFVDQPNIIEGQVIQETLDTFTVKVVPSSSFCQTDIEDIKQRMVQRLGSQVTVQVETVAEIPRTKSGKFRAIISNYAKPSNKS